MPVFKRKRFSRRPLKSTKRMFKRRRVVRVRRPLTSHVYKFSRWCSAIGGYNVNTTHQWDSGNFIMYNQATGTNVEWDGAMSFRFSDLKNTGEFSNLFDRYMITGVRVQFQLITNPDSSSQLNLTTPVQQANWYPKLWYTVDNDDVSLVTRSQIQEYTGAKCRVLRPNNITKVYIPFPRTAGGVYSGTTPYAAKVNGATYLDMASRDIDHYGLKYAVDFLGLPVTATAPPFAIKIDLKYYFKCKDAR